MFLGPVNVRANRKDVQLKVKEEYNSFRVRVSSFDFYGLALFKLLCGRWVMGICLDH